MAEHHRVWSHGTVEASDYVSMNLVQAGSCRAW
jgi:hypothetical protein